MFKKANATRSAPNAWDDQPAEKTPKPTFQKSYSTFCYRLFGTRFDQGTGSELMAERLKQAGMNVTPGMYYSVMAFTTVLATVGMFAFSALLFVERLRIPDWYGYVALIPGMTLLACLAGFRF